MKAYANQARCSIVAPYHPLDFPVDGALVTTHLPNVSVSFSGTPPTEALEVLRSGGSQEILVKGAKIFVIPSPDRQTLKVLASAGAIRTTPAASGSANLAALGSLALIRKIFTQFLLTHQYPAFKDKAHMQLVEDHWKVVMGQGKRKRATMDQPGPSRKKTIGVDGDEDMEEDDVEIEDDNESSGAPGDKIIFAVPPPPVEKGWGDESEVPEGEGIFIQFIDETQNWSGERQILETINRYFLGALGQNAADVKKTYARLRVDNGVLVHTLEGRELSHIAKCIDVGIQAQARIFPIVSDGQYLGCVLSGSGFQLSAYESAWVPVEHQLLVDEVMSAGSHKAALTDIGRIVDKDMAEVFQQVTETLTIIGLRDILMEAPLSNEQRSQIVAIAKNLRYPQNSLNVSAANLETCLRLIQHPEESIDDTFPIHYTKLFETDRVNLVWSAFGALAPTCQFAGGPIVDLKTSKNLPKHVAFRLIPLKDALIDIQKILAEQKFNSTSSNRRSAPFRDRMYSGMDATRILSALAAASGVELTKDTGKKKAPAVGTSSTLFDDGF